jgi:O-succinylbenzoic acid--CoA ligase
VLQLLDRWLATDASDASIAAHAHAGLAANADNGIAANTGGALAANADDDIDVELATPLVVRTSGSTGEPKDVALSRAAVVASAEATHRRLGGPGQWLLALPAHYVAGLQVLVRSRLAGTTPVLLDDHPGLASATKALQHDRRYLAAVPTQLHRWLADQASADALATYDAVLIGGGATDPDLLHAAADAGIRLVTTYGMTETCGGCVYDGLPLDGVRVALGRDGQIRIAGPVLFDGYLGEPERTEEVLHQGWLLTPDRGRFDGDGRLEVLGRLDDVAVSGGVKVPLDAVRRRLMALPELAEVEVVALPDLEWGQRVVVVAVPATDGMEPDLATVRDWVAAELPRTWAPRELVVRATLPTLASGKADRIALVAELAART